MRNDYDENVMSVKLSLTTINWVFINSVRAVSFKEKSNRNYFDYWSIVTLTKLHCTSIVSIRMIGYPLYLHNESHLNCISHLHFLNSKYKPVQEYNIY